MNTKGAPEGAAVIRTDNTKPSGALGRLLTARELGDVLGFAAGTIVDWAERDELPAFKIGGRLRFRQSEVEAWLEEQRR